MKIMKSVLAGMLVAVIVTVIPLESDVSLAKRKTPPSKVYGLKLVKDGKKAITIKWRKARRAKKYIIYRSKGRKGRFIKRAVTRRTRFTDYRVRSGKVYRYFVRGYNGRVGKRSGIIKIRAKKARYFLKRWKIGGNGKTLYNHRTQGTSNVIATLYKNGVLKIKGRGNTAPFYDYISGNTVFSPWEKSKINGTYCNKLIRSVYVGENVRATNISRWFVGCENLKKINRIPRAAKEMNFTFLRCKNLYKSPAIPKGVKHMLYTFAKSGLRKPPVLPEGVEDLRFMFYKCVYITKAPKIPKSAINIDSMFENCENLRNAADIREGNNINFATYMYANCKKLTGMMFIRGALTEANVSCFFKNAATESDDGLKVLYPHAGDQKLRDTAYILTDTKSPDSNIETQEYFF